MRRFNYANRSALFTSNNAYVTAKRELGIPSANEFNFVMRFVLFSGFTAAAGLLFGEYKMDRYIEKSSAMQTEAKMPEITFGPNTKQEAESGKPNLEKWDMTGFEPNANGDLCRYYDSYNQLPPYMKRRLSEKTASPKP